MSQEGYAPIHLQRARAVRGNAQELAQRAEFAGVDEFRVYGHDEDTLVCQGRDLLKCDTIVLRAMCALDLALLVKAAFPTRMKLCGDVVEKFGIRDCIDNSHDDIPFVGVGNCWGNVQSEGSDLFPCSLTIGFLKAVPRGSAFVMGSLHNVDNLSNLPCAVVTYDHQDAQYVTQTQSDFLPCLHSQVAQTLHRGMGTFAIHDIAPNSVIGICDLMSVEKIAKSIEGNQDVGDRYENDFVTFDSKGRPFACAVYDSTSVVTSANEALPMYAHTEECVCKLEFVDIDQDTAQLCLKSSINDIVAGAEIVNRSYGFFDQNCKRQSYRWQSETNFELDKNVYTPYYDKTDGWLAHRVLEVLPSKNKSYEHSTVCAHNDGSELAVKFTCGSEGIVDNHVEDLGSVTHTWVVTRPAPCTSPSEQRLQTLLSSAKVTTCYSKVQRADEQNNMQCTTKVLASTQSLDIEDDANGLFDGFTLDMELFTENESDAVYPCPSTSDYQPAEIITPATKRKPEVKPVAMKRRPSSHKKICVMQGCQKMARSGFSKCFKHGGGRVCTHEGCGNMVQMKGLCVKHGGRMHLK